MKRCRDAFRWSLFVVLCVAGGWDDRRHLTAKNQEPGQYSIRTTSRLVLLDVGVKNAMGDFVPGLGKPNFEVYENGRSSRSPRSPMRTHPSP